MQTERKEGGVCVIPSWQDRTVISRFFMAKNARFEKENVVIF